MRKPSFYLTSAVLTIFLLSGCDLFDKDIKFGRNLEGEWEVISLTQDELETMGLLYSKIELEFEDYDKGDGEGDFSTRYYYPSGDIHNSFGEYEVNDQGVNLELSYSTGTTVLWTIYHLKGDQLELELMLNGSIFYMKAERD